ncbi:hypothetical protein ACLB1R_31935 [Escherichia coli]
MPKFGPLAGLRVASRIDIRLLEQTSGYGVESYLHFNVAWADTIRVQPNYPQLSRRNGAVVKYFQR